MSFAFTHVANRFLLVAALAVLGDLGTGCATWQRHGVALDGRKLKVAVLPIQTDVRIGQLSAIKSVSKQSARADPDVRAIEDELRWVEASLAQAISNRLNQSYFFVNSTSSSATNSLRVGAMTTNEVCSLASSLSADVLMQVRIAGYGRIKRKWMFYLGASALVEGTVQGVAAAAVINEPWVGVAVAAEEFLQELVVWGGGVYLFDHVFTPVILEAELYSGHDGAVIWSDTAFQYRNPDALEKLPIDEQAKKEVRLKLTADLAVEELVRDLDDIANRNARAFVAKPHP